MQVQHTRAKTPSGSERCLFFGGKKGQTELWSLVIIIHDTKPASTHADGDVCVRVCVWMRLDPGFVGWVIRGGGLVNYKLQDKSQF